MIGVSQISIVAYRGGGGAAPVNLDFVTTWDTTKAGSASDTVVLPLLSGGTYNGTIDWGDGNSDALSYANRTHVYASSGTYTITISGSDIQGFRFNNGGDRLKITDISNWGNLTITTSGAFFGCGNLDVSAIDAPTISSADQQYLFSGCALTTPDFSSWNVSGINSLYRAFQNNSSMVSAELGSWDVSNITNFRECFSGCSVFNDDITNWNTSSGTNFISMLANCFDFDKNLSGWSVSGFIESMFSRCKSFNNGGSPDINNWNTSTVTSMKSTFSGADSFNQPIGNWDVSNVVNFSTANSSMLTDTLSFDQDISNWVINPSVTSFFRMFRNSAFNGDLNSWDMSNIQNIREMFDGNNSFDQDISSWDITNVNNGTNFLRNGALSTTNYDALLVGWEATLQAAWPGGVGYPYTININFGGSKYTAASAAATARASLVTIFGWTITDGGAV